MEQTAASNASAAPQRILYKDEVPQYFPKKQVTEPDGKVTEKFCCAVKLDSGEECKAGQYSAASGFRSENFARHLLQKHKGLFDTFMKTNKPKQASQRTVTDYFKETEKQKLERQSAEETRVIVNAVCCVPGMTSSNDRCCCSFVAPRTAFNSSPTT